MAHGEKDMGEKSSGVMNEPPLSGPDTAVAKPKIARGTKQRTKRPPTKQLPPYRVLLHNDDENEINFVIETVIEIARLEVRMAKRRVVEANDTGLALLLVTHREKAELLEEQFRSKGLVVTIEPAD